METFAHLGIEKQEGAPPAKFYIPQLPDPAFSELLAFARNLGIDDSRGNSPSLISIRTPPDNPSLKEFFARLRQLGWEARDTFVSPTQEAGQFKYRISRTYDQYDLDAAEFLYLINWPHLTDFAGRDGERWIGDVDYVGADSGQGWEQQIGTIGMQSFFVNPAIKHRMIEFGLIGLKFHELSWNKPSASKAQYWELDTEFFMPPCLLPVVNMDGPLNYEEGAYFPVELKFHRSDLVNMPTFDVAWTQETVGDLRREDRGRHWLVVSQKFRRFFLSANLAMNYGVVRLVD